MENKKKNTGAIALVVLLLIVTIASLVLATYAWAKYTTTTSKDTTAVVAKWNVSGSSDKLNWSRTFTHVVAERLAPGTNGTIPVEFGINDTEVDVNYVITLVTATNQPTNLKFYADAQKSKEITVGGTAFSGQIAHDSDSKKFTGAIYWDWPYESGDDTTDTTEGVAAKTMTVSIKIDATQVEPK